MGGAQGQRLRGLTHDQAGDHAAVPGRDLVGAIFRSNSQTGKNNRLEELGLAAKAADARQIGPHVAALTDDAVATVTAYPGREEDVQSRVRVAAKRGQIQLQGA